MRNNRHKHREKLWKGREKKEIVKAIIVYRWARKIYGDEVKEKPVSPPSLGGIYFSVGYIGLY